MRRPEKNKQLANFVDKIVVYYGILILILVHSNKKMNYVETI